MNMRFCKFITILLVLGLSACEGVYDPKIISPVQMGVKDKYPAWSPDGSKIVYYHVGITDIKDRYNYSIDIESRGLWLVNSDGSNPRIILHVDYAHAFWEDESTLLASLNGDIFRIPLNEDEIDTVNVEQLTDTGDNFWPSISYDGQWIAYDSEYNSIWQMKADGTRKKRVKQYARMPHYAPDTYRIVFGASHDGLAEIYSMIDIGTDVRLLTQYGESDHRRYPKYSPDGEMIVFQEKGKILIMNVDGSELHQIRFVSDIFNLFMRHNLNCGQMPNWSPDSQKIVFIRCGLADLKNYGTVWTANLDGSELKQMTFYYE